MSGVLDSNANRMGPFQARGLSAVSVLFLMLFAVPFISGAILTSAISLIVAISPSGREVSFFHVLGWFFVGGISGLFVGSVPAFITIIVCLIILLIAKRIFLREIFISGLFCLFVCMQFWLSNFGSSMSGKTMGAYGSGQLFAILAVPTIIGTALIWWLTKRLGWVRREAI